MIDFASAMALSIAPVKKPLLPTDVREKMIQLHWTEVHQSGLSKGRECPKRLKFALAEDSERSRRVGSIYMLLGSVFHNAMEFKDQTASFGDTYGYWMDIFAMLMSDQDYYFNGKLVEESDVVEFSRKLADSSTFYGIRTMDIIEQMYVDIDNYGFTVESVEKRMEFKDGFGSSAVSFVGTADMILKSKHGPFRCLMDTKTSGLWGPLLGTGSVKKQSWDMVKIQFHPQLRHYDWMLNKIDPSYEDIQSYGLMFPANLVPYVKGKEAGQARGAVMQMAVKHTYAQRQMYERDMVETITQWVRHGFYRGQPLGMGFQPACPDCPFFGSCMGSDRMVSTGEAFKDYLKSYETAYNTSGE
jgi:hypothetical protein